MPTKTKAAIAEPVEETVEEDFDGYDDESDLDDETLSEDEELEADEEGDDEQEVEQPARIVGQELLDFVREQKALGRTLPQMAFDAGYYTVTKDGIERVVKAQFSQAYLEAQGLDFGGPAPSGRRGGNGLVRARVSGQNIGQVSPAAIAKVGAAPGSLFEVTFPTDDLVGPGAQILLTLTAEVDPVTPRKRDQAPEEPGTPLLDQAA